MTDIATMLADPAAQRLIGAVGPARLAYEADDGTPRVVTVGFHVDGDTIVTASVPASPKVAALAARPAVTLTFDTVDRPSQVLLVRGLARLATVSGVPDAYLAGARKLVPADRWDAFEAGVRGLYREMTLITITATSARVLDLRAGLVD